MNLLPRMNADPATIEHDIDATRARVDEVLHALQAKLSPAQLRAQARHYLEDRGARLAKRVGRNVRDNPWPIVIGVLVAVSWVVLKRRSGTKRLRHFL